jgi:outer membrane lipoprotein-sorting protein
MGWPCVNETVAKDCGGSGACFTADCALPQKGRFDRSWDVRFGLDRFQGDCMTLFRAATATLFACLLAFGAPAEAAKPLKQLSAEQSQALDEITGYLAGYKNLKGEFTQVSPKGNVSRGIFFLSKPGKMRFEYAPPNPFLIVSDGRWVTIKNTKKEKGDQYPLSQTPLRLVLGEGINIRKETNIYAIDTAGGLTTVTLEDRKGNVPGYMILVYDRERQNLQQWVVVDGKGGKTTVTLENVEQVAKVDPKLFIVKIKRKEREAK